MRTFGEDRCRPAGDRLILLSAIPKGWVARVPKTATSSEHPGTAVLWDEQYFEVVEVASAGGDRVRYLLAPWREEHTMRTVEAYDEESEARRIADFEAAKKQRRASASARWSALLLGHLPVTVQERMQNQLGVNPSRMTLISCIPPVVLFGVCVYRAVAAFMGGDSKVPIALFLFAAYGMLDSLVRMHVALSTGRGIGSLIGWLVYSLYWIVSPKRARLVPPVEKGDDLKLFTLPPTAETEMQDRLTMRAPLLTLLSEREQQQLAGRYGYDYRRNAFAVAWLLLVCSLVGAVSAFARVQEGAGAATFVSMVVAGAIALEQVVRLMQLQRGPSSSFLGALVRPFVRDLVR